MGYSQHKHIRDDDPSSSSLLSLAKELIWLKYSMGQNAFKEQNVFEHYYFFDSFILSFDHLTG